MTSDKCVRKLVQVRPLPTMPPICCANHRTGIADTATNDDICTLFEGSRDAQSPQICLRVYRLELPVIQFLPRAYVLERRLAALLCLEQFWQHFVARYPCDAQPKSFRFDHPLYHAMQFLGVRCASIDCHFDFMLRDMGQRRFEGFEEGGFVGVNLSCRSSAHEATSETTIIPLAFAFARPVMFPSLIQSPTSTSIGSFS